MLKKQQNSQTAFIFFMFTWLWQLYMYTITNKLVFMLTHSCSKPQNPFYFICNHLQMKRKKRCNLLNLVLCSTCILWQTFYVSYFLKSHRHINMWPKTNLFDILKRKKCMRAKVCTMFTPHTVLKKNTQFAKILLLLWIKLSFKQIFALNMKQFKSTGFCNYS